ncbi:hypothetical protein [Gordonia sp. NPDC003376]
MSVRPAGAGGPDVTCGRRWRRPRNDASTIIGMQSPVAFGVIIWFATAAVVASGYGTGGVVGWPVFGVALALSVIGAVVLLLAPDDPIAAPATVVIAGTPSVTVLLVMTSVEPPPAVAFGVVAGCISATLAFLCVRGRVLAAWIGFVASVVVSVAGGLFLTGTQAWLSAEIPGVAVLLMSTLFATIIRPAAREIYALRAQTLLEVTEEAATRATLAERDAQLARLDEQARVLLECIASAQVLTEADTLRAGLLERRLRDGIRAPALDAPEVVDAAWAARERGVAVTLLDDARNAARPEALAGVRSVVVEILSGLGAGAAVTVRVSPPGRDPFATIVIREGDTKRRVDYHVLRDHPVSAIELADGPRTGDTPADVRK